MDLETIRFLDDRRKVANLKNDSFLYSLIGLLLLLSSIGMIWLSATNISHIASPLILKGTLNYTHYSNSSIILNSTTTRLFIQSVYTTDIGMWVLIVFFITALIGVWILFISFDFWSLASKAWNNYKFERGVFQARYSKLLKKMR